MSPNFSPARARPELPKLTAARRVFFPEPGPGGAYSGGWARSLLAVSSLLGSSCLRHLTPVARRSSACLFLSLSGGECPATTQSNTRAVAKGQPLARQVRLRSESSALSLSLSLRARSPGQQSSSFLSLERCTPIEEHALLSSHYTLHTQRSTRPQTPTVQATRNAAGTVPSGQLSTSQLAR